MTRTPSRCAMRARIVFASIGLFVGISILLMFGMVYNNWDTAVWGIASGVFAAMALALHVMYMRNPWTIEPSFLTVMILVGCFGQIISLAATICYITIAVVQHQGMSAAGKSYYVAAVWTAMTWKWSFLLFYYSRQYRNLQKILSVQADPAI